jgi:hypothetical protein
MDGAIRLVIEDLRVNHSDARMANELEQVWEESSVDFEASLDLAVSLLDLGDHAPLIPQLDELLQKLADQYGPIIKSLPIVKEIQEMNYAIPVVFKPKGAWQDPAVDNRIEYRKHFIPFANFVTYYAALITCNIIAKKQNQPELKKVCKQVSEKLKFAMGRYVAPTISDWIFKAANRGTTQGLNISPMDLRYNTVEELRQAIRN